MSWRIQIADRIDDSGKERLRDQATIIEDAGLDSIDTMDALIVRSSTKVTREVIERSQPRLRVIGRAGVGVDNIDLNSAREFGIAVVNAPEAATNAVAEHVLALIFALARNLIQADNSMKDGQWIKKKLKGFEVQDRRLGVIGMGRIGSTVVAKGLALGLDVVGYDPPIPNPKIERAGARSLELHQLLAASDFVSLHVPLKPETKLLIGAAELKLMKPSSYLISTARGEVVDEVALKKALDEGLLAGAALDVFNEEPPQNEPLIQHPKLIATPHIASQTLEAQRQAAVDIADEVLAALNGEGLRWQVA